MIEAPLARRYAKVRAFQHVDLLLSYPFPDVYVCRINHGLAARRTSHSIVKPLAPATIAACHAPGVAGSPDEDTFAQFAAEVAHVANGFEFTPAAERHDPVSAHARETGMRMHPALDNQALQLITLRHDVVYK
jgi:hypothetical protein